MICYKKSRRRLRKICGRYVETKEKNKMKRFQSKKLITEILLKLTKEQIIKID